MATGTPFHPRTAPLNRSLAWRPWGGYFAALHYDDHPQREYAAIRNGAALIDISPLHKYRLSGRDAARLLDRVVTRDVSRLAVGQVAYTPWCDRRGKVLQEGTVFRLAEERFQLNATEPAYRWLSRNAAGLAVEIEDRSATLAALAVQGPRSRDLLARLAEAEVAALPFFRLTAGRLAGQAVWISRTGYTGDLGYELWVEAAGAPAVWDALVAAGEGCGVTPCGLLAMDVARIEAGFVLLGVDYVGADRALIPSQLSSPYELGLGWAVHLAKATPCVGRPALAAERLAASATRLVGLEIPWEPLEALYAEVGLLPELPTVAWRTPVPVFAGGRQVGRATSGCWSTRLKKYLALATLEAAAARPGHEVGMEVTVDHRRRQAPARVVELPFFRPSRMRG